MELLDAKKKYESMKHLDPEGWYLYRACKQLLEIDIYKFYIAEDTIGRFEDSDGHELRHFTEIAAFAQCTYKVISNCYEVLDTYHLDKESQAYQEYLAGLYPLAIQRIDEMANSHQGNGYYEEEDEREV